MNNDKFTPGPWTVDNQYIHGPDGIRFLAVAGDGAGQANARLIASAPTMFDYLTLLASRGNDEAHEIIKKITGP